MDRGRGAWQRVYWSVKGAWWRCRSYCVRSGSREGARRNSERVNRSRHGKTKQLCLPNVQTWRTSQPELSCLRPDQAQAVARHAVGSSATPPRVRYTTYYQVCFTSIQPEEQVFLRTFSMMPSLARAARAAVRDAASHARTVGLLLQHTFRITPSDFFALADSSASLPRHDRKHAAPGSRTSCLWLHTDLQMFYKTDN